MTDLLSPSPYAYLDALTPAERQAEIARRQHSRREEWCDDARRARDYQAEAATLEAAAVANIESYETSLSECLSRIAELEAALDMFVSYGCPICGGDCASANPPVSCCPMQSARAALRK